MEHFEFLTPNEDLEPRAKPVPPRVARQASREEKLAQALADLADDSMWDEDIRSW